jgi:MFS family permease
MSPDELSPEAASRRPRLPRTVWVLGVTSLFMDSSSEIAHAILPLLLVNGLGASVFLVGIIDGLAEATASITKIFSGALSDHWRNRKGIAAFGYAVSALSKVIFPLATTPFMVFAGRFADRFGKGVRGAPRDALIADWVPPAHRGYAYGVRQGLDNIGAVAGPLAAIGLLQLYSGDLVTVLWWAVVPAVIAVLIMYLGVREPAVTEPRPQRPFPLRLSELRLLGGAFWLAMGLLFILLLPRFSEAFQILRAQDLGVDPAWAPMTLVVMNLVAVPLTPLAGIWSDRVGRMPVIATGFAMLALSHALMALATGPILVWVGAGIWGLHLAFTQGVFSALVADYAPAHLRGTAFGIFNLAAGIAILIGSAGMGLVWDRASPATAFAWAAAITVLGLVLFLLPRRTQTL